MVTNGTAVLGLGNIGPLAAKPVMEGKGVLFKKFAGIDVFDIELNELDPDRLIEVIAALEPTFGGINLEDIKAPECFYIESKLRERLKIPVFHDDQHGTAIIVGAAIVNGLRVVGKKIGEVKLAVSGAGAAALSCLDMLVALGLKLENIWVSDIAGVVYEGRKELMDENKARYAKKTDARTLGDIIGDADIFLGLSAGGVLKPDMVKRMAANPLILALANPVPEILPAEVKAVRDDAIIATGRSDYPNQVNNVLCFPFIFRGALDVGATTINEPMKLAAVNAIADLAMAEQSDIVALAYQHEQMSFGPRVPHPEAVRPAPDREDRPGGREGGDGQRRGHEPDPRPRRLRPAPERVRLPLRPHHAAHLRRGEGLAEAHRVRRGRGRARAARRAGGGRREARAPDPRRAARGAREAHRALRPAPERRRALRRREPGMGRPLPRLLDRIPPPHRAPRRVGAVREDRDAPPPHAHRRDDDPQGRGRRHDLRHLRHARACTCTTSTR